MSQIVERFERLLRESPNRALMHLPAHSTTLTASALGALQQQYVDTFRSQGLGGDALVLSAAGNCPDSLAVLLAAWSIGAPVMPIDTGTPPAEIVDLATQFHASAIVLPADMAGKYQGAAQALNDRVAFVRRDDGPVALGEEATLLKLTSGSTGLPRAILATDTQILEDTSHIVEAMGIAPDDTQIAAIPLSHAYGFGNLVMPMFVQGTAIVLRESFVPQQLPADARCYKGSIFPGVPFMFQHFLAHPPDQWPATLQLLISAGAPLEADTARQFHDRFGLKIHPFYGASETGGICYEQTDDLDGLSSVGWPMPHVAVTLHPGDGIPDGCGRIHVQSPAVGVGYVDGRDATDVFTCSTFVTGDYGFFSEDGRLVLKGRITSFINVAGRKVAPGEVERVLRSIAGVRDARVVGVADSARGEAVVAIVARNGPLTAAEVRQQCAPLLAPHKIPRSVVFVDSIPVTARGKVDRRALDALVRAHLDGAS